MTREKNIIREIPGISYVRPGHFHEPAELPGELAKQ